MRRAFAILASGAFAASGCLVNDPRPPPGSLLVTASPDQAITTGVVSDDGWAVEYPRFLVSLGNASIEDEDGTCNHTYSDPTYQRVIDLSQGSGQKVNLAFGLGSCSLDLELSSPRGDSVLGKGVSAEDRDFMRTPASDDFVSDGGISIHVVGRATKAGVEKRFTWSYRFRVDYTTVGVSVGGQIARGLELEEDQRLTWDFPIRGAALLWDHREPSAAALRFDAIASADDTYGDGNGDVTLAELGAVPLADIAASDRYDDAASDWLTLQDFVYAGLFRRVVDANALEEEVFPNDRNPH